MTTEDRAGEGETTARRGGPAAAPDVRRSRLRAAARGVLGLSMIAVGALHFVTPQVFERMVPSGLPAPLALVYVSGVAEIAGGVGLFLPRLRRAAAWGLIALYVAVFPANVNMAIHGLPLGDVQLSPFQLWARLPLQLVFIAWAYWVGKPGPAKGDRPAERP